MIKDGLRSERGISLIETAIAVLIISLLVFPMLKLMEVGNESRLKQEGIARNTAVVAALERYWMDNGRLPRPASTYSVPGDSDYGQEATVDDIQKWWEWNVRRGRPVLEGVQDVPGGGNTGWNDVSNLIGNVNKNTLRIAGAGWENNQWVGSYVRLRCLDGDGSSSTGTWHGSFRLIVSNTTDTITLSPNSVSYTDTSGSSYKAWYTGADMDVPDKLGQKTGGTDSCPKSQYVIYYGVLIGSVPFAELGLSENQSLDPYNRRLTYMATASMTGQKTVSGELVPTAYAGQMEVGAIFLINQLFGRGEDWEKAYLANGLVNATGGGGASAASKCRMNSTNDTYTRLNCCSNNQCYPGTRAQYTMLDKSTVPFVLINHGRDGRGAIPRIPSRVTVSDVPGIASILGVSGSDTVIRAEPYASCAKNLATYGNVAANYYKFSVTDPSLSSIDTVGLGFDNCDHTIADNDITYNDANWYSSLYNGSFNLSTVRVIQREFKESNEPVLGAIVQRFTYNPGPFYYDDIVTYSAGVDMRGWSERSTGKMLKQTSAELGSGWTMISSSNPTAPRSLKPAFPLQIGLQPDDSGFNDTNYINSPANLRAKKLYTDLICSYGKESGGLGSTLVGAPFSYSGSVTANARMGCFSIGRLLSSLSYVQDMSAIESRRPSFLCTSEVMPISGVDVYNITDNNDTNVNSRYFRRNTAPAGIINDSFMAPGFSSSARKEPFMWLNDKSCTQPRLDDDAVEYHSSCASSDGAKTINVSGDGSVDLVCN